MTNRHILGMLLAVAGTLGSAAAQERGRAYVEGGVGVTLPVDDRETVTFIFSETDTFTTFGSSEVRTGPTGRLLAGYRVIPSIAVEVEAQYTSADVDDPRFENLDVAAFTVNVVYALPTSGRYTPYAGVGLGYATFDLQTREDEFTGGPGGDYDGYEGEIAYRVKAGLAVSITERQSITLQAAYLNADTFETATSDSLSFQEVDTDYATVDFTVGYRFDFR